MRAFESLEDIKNATVDSLSEVPGMDRRAAEAVAGYFSQINDVLSLKH